MNQETNKSIDMNKTYIAVKEKIQELVPELVRKEYTHEPSLVDVLSAIDSNHIRVYGSHGDGMATMESVPRKKSCRYNLKNDRLSAQSEEVWDFLSETLKVKK